MRVLVTGATGFVGRWLIEELRAAGHEAVPTPPSRAFDITDGMAVRQAITAAEPDAVAHLAATSHALDAARDPEAAIRVNAGGTQNVIEAVGALGRHVPVLVTGSSEVYGSPLPEDLPLREDAPLRASKPYGRSKLAQEGVALETGRLHGVPVVVTRAFNHTGPGQRSEFVAPAFALRILAARDAGETRVKVGNLAVERDFADVRDVARAYRLLLEGLAAGSIETGLAVNVASGKATAIAHILEVLGEIIEVPLVPVVDPSQVRADDPPRIVGDASRLRDLTGWHPTIPIEVTLSDLVGALDHASRS